MNEIKIYEYKTWEEFCEKFPPKVDSMWSPTTNLRIKNGKLQQKYMNYTFMYDNIIVWINVQEINE